MYLKARQLIYITKIVGGAQLCAHEEAKLFSPESEWKVTLTTLAAWLETFRCYHWSTAVLCDILPSDHTAQKHKHTGQGRITVGIESQTAYIAYCCSLKMRHSTIRIVMRLHGFLRESSWLHMTDNFVPMILTCTGSAFDALGADWPSILLPLKHMYMGKAKKFQIGSLDRLNSPCGVMHVETDSFAQQTSGVLASGESSRGKLCSRPFRQ